MTEQKYTVSQIEKLRELCTCKFYNGVYILCAADYEIFHSRILGLSNHEEKTLEIEEQVRTLLIAGITPEDIIESEEKRHTSYAESQKG